MMVLGVPYYSYRKIYPQNPVLIIKAPQSEASFLPTTMRMVVHNAALTIMPVRRRHAPPVELLGFDAKPFKSINPEPYIRISIP